MPEKKETFVRINSRIRKDQHKNIKVEAKKLKISEGELHRNIVDFYFANKK